jgi:hypothetical protein
MRFYTDKTREQEPWALPNAEVFELTQQDFIRASEGSCQAIRMKEEMETAGGNFEAAANLAGWYWWPCFPGCMPEAEPFGPFETEAEAVADARQQDE